MALPVIFEPVVVDGRVMMDGGLVNPLPFDIVSGEADLTVAIDVSGAPVPGPSARRRRRWRRCLRANFLFRALHHPRKTESHRQPDIYINAGTSRFQILDFLKVDEILAAAEPAKEKLKAQLARVLAVETLGPSTR